MHVHCYTHRELIYPYPISCIICRPIYVHIIWCIWSFMMIYLWCSIYKLYICIYVCSVHTYLWKMYRYESVWKRDKWIFINQPIKFPHSSVSSYVWKLVIILIYFLKIVYVNVELYWKNIYYWWNCDNGYFFNKIELEKRFFYFSISCSSTLNATSCI